MKATSAMKESCVGPSKSSYVAVPTGDHDNAMKDSMKGQPATSILRRLFRSCTVLLFVGASLHFMHKVMFNHHMVKFMHFDQLKHPCPHHVRFQPHHDVVLQPMHQNMDYDRDVHTPDYKGMIHPLPPLNMEVEKPSFWKTLHMGHSSDDSKEELPSLDSSDSSDSDDKDLDVWERIANMWTGNDHSSDDSKDSAESLDIWERIADVFTGNDSKDSADSLDVWERIANVWTGSEDSVDDSKDSADSLDVWERMANVWTSSKDSVDDDEIGSGKGSSE
jgi:hypothetical protein